MLRPPTAAPSIRRGSRVFLSGHSAWQSDGTVAGLGDAGAQAHAALDGIESALAGVGGSLRDITKLTTFLVDRDHSKPAYEAIGGRLREGLPVSTNLIVAGLPSPELMVQIDVEAVIGQTMQRHRTFPMKQWFGQDIPWQGAMVVTSASELFVCGQTGSTLDGSVMAGLGRRPEDAAAQADLALINLATLLGEAGASLSEVCKITVYISDRAYRAAVYPVIGRHFRGIHPVSTGLIVSGFVRPEILFEIDVLALRQTGGPHQRFRRYHSDAVRYGLERQALDCDFCMAVRAGDYVVLRGQTGADLAEMMHGLGDPVAQAEQAMQNVGILLQETGSTLFDIVKVTVFVTDRAFLPAVSEVVLRPLQGVVPCFSALVVKGLASPELLMEVDVTAIVR